MQDLQAQDDTYAQQVSDQQAAQKVKEQQPADQQPSLLERFAGNVGKMTLSSIDSAVSSAESFANNDPTIRKVRDAQAGFITGAVNNVEATGIALASSGRGMAAAEDPEHAEDALGGVMPTSPIWDHAKASVMDFRDAIAVKDPTLSDSLTQGAAQIIPSFMGYSKLLSGLHGFANMLGAGALTDTMAMAPGDSRVADILALGRHTEGKFGDVLSQIAPKGSFSGTLLDHYINFLGHDGPESEAESRFKNAIDGAVGNVAFSGLLHATGVVLKQGTAGLRYAVENGVGSAGDLMPTNQEGKIGYHGSDTPGIQKFDSKALGEDEKSASHGVGLYVADDQDAAKIYAKSRDSLYKVHVPDEHVNKMLDWQKPLVDQPDVMRKLANANIHLDLPTEATGQDLMEKLGKTRATSVLLDSLDIPGVRYPASGKYSNGGSKGAVSVVFNPEQKASVVPHGQDMSLSPQERALERERVAAQRDREGGVSREHEPEIIPRRAAEHEGEVARRSKEN